MELLSINVTTDLSCISWKLTFWAELCSSRTVANCYWPSVCELLWSTAMELRNLRRFLGALWAQENMNIVRYALMTTAFKLLRFVFSVFQAGVWQLNGTAKQVREAHYPENYDRSVHMLDIHVIHRLDDYQLFTMNNFICTHNRFESPQYVLDNDSINLMFVTDTHAVFCEPIHKGRPCPHSNRSARGYLCRRWLPGPDCPQLLGSCKITVVRHVSDRFAHHYYDTTIMEYSDSRFESNRFADSFWANRLESFRFVKKSAIQFGRCIRLRYAFAFVDMHLWKSEFSPFIGHAQARYGSKLIVVPLPVFRRMAECIGDPNGELIFIFHTARCGSTLLVQVNNMIV